MLDATKIELVRKRLAEKFPAAVIDARAPGEGTLNGRALALDGLVSIATAAETVNTPVPEPGTVLLLGSGLVGLLVFGKRPAA